MSELRSVTYRMKAEHAATLRKVGNALSSSPLRGAKAESFLVGLLLMDLADKVDHAFQPAQATNVVPLRRVETSGEAGER